MHLANGRFMETSHRQRSASSVIRIGDHSVDLNLLIVLDAIYTEGSVTRAAKTLHLSQPAVSHALGRLRRLFDDPLFTRQGRTMVPTPVAHHAIDGVRQALQLIESSLVGAERFDPGTAGRSFTIGVRDHLEAVLLPPLMARLERVAPGVAFNFVRGERRKLERDLAVGDLDVALDVLLPLDDSIRRQRIGSDPLVVAMRDDHPLVSEPLDLEAYLGAQHIQVSGRRTGMSTEDFELSRQGLRRHVRVRCQNHFAAWETARRTDLMLTLPEGYARSLQRQSPAAVLACPVPVVTLERFVYWHASRDDDPANHWVRNQLADLMATLGRQ